MNKDTLNNDLCPKSARLSSELLSAHPVPPTTPGLSTTPPPPAPFGSCISDPPTARARLLPSVELSAILYKWGSVQIYKVRQLMVLASPQKLAFSLQVAKAGCQESLGQGNLLSILLTREVRSSKEIQRLWVTPPASSCHDDSTSSFHWKGRGTLLPH